MFTFASHSIKTIFSFELFFEWFSQDAREPDLRLYSHSLVCSIPVNVGWSIFFSPPRPAEYNSMRANRMFSRVSSVNKGYLSNSIPIQAFSALLNLFCFPKLYFYHLLAVRLDYIFAIVYQNKQSREASSHLCIWIVWRLIDPLWNFSVVNLFVQKKLNASTLWKGGVPKRTKLFGVPRWKNCGSSPVIIS